MPLIKSASKAAFSKNVAKEMDSGKPQDQSLAIAYDIKNRNKKRKKMAEGGMANESAASERRPMPDERDKDSKMVSRNSSNKAPGEDSWTDQPTVRQAQKPSITPLSRPKMANGAFKVRDRADVDKEEMMMSKMPPASPEEQPDKEYDEQGPDRQGPKVPDMQDSHSTKRKPYAKGGQVEASDYSAAPNKYEDDLLDLPPSEDEGASAARSHDEEGQDRQGPQVPDMEREHSNGRMPYARGGEVELHDGQPEEEYDMDHEDSIAAAIMAKKERQMRLDSDSDIDHMLMMADGGDVKDSSDEDKQTKNQDAGKNNSSTNAAGIASWDDMKKNMGFAEGGAIYENPRGKYNGSESIYSDDSDQADLKRNAEEDANMEDRSSFNAMRKENYSESEGLSQLDQPSDSNEHGHEIDSDKHDMIDMIRSKMKRQRQFKAR